MCVLWFNSREIIYRCNLWAKSGPYFIQLIALKPRRSRVCTTWIVPFFRGKKYHNTIWGLNLLRTGPGRRSCHTQGMPRHAISWSRVFRSRMISPENGRLAKTGARAEARMVSVEQWSREEPLFNNTFSASMVYRNFSLYKLWHFKLESLFLFLRKWENTTFKQ